MCRENLAGAIVLPYNVEHVGETIVIVMAYIRAKERLCHRTGRVGLMERVDNAVQL